MLRSPAASLLAELDTTAEQRMATLPSLLRKRASQCPERLALRDKQRGIWQCVSWADYYRNVGFLATYLRSQGIVRSSAVAIIGDGSPGWFYADLATQALGGVSVGVYPTNPWAELQYIVRHCQASIVVCGDQEQADKVLEASEKEGGLPLLKRIIVIDPKGMRHYSDPRIVMLDDALQAGADRWHTDDGARMLDAAIDTIQPRDDAIIVYTSGTTGMPKGARISHLSIILASQRLGEVHAFRGRHLSALCYLPLCHVAERLFSTVSQLVWNGVVNFAESIDTVVNDLREIAPSYFLGVPRIWEKMQRDILISSSESHPIARRAFAAALRLGQNLAIRALDNGGRLSSRLDAATMVMLHYLMFRNLRAAMGLDKMFFAAAGGAPVATQTTLFFKAIGIQIHEVYGMTETCGLINIQRPDAIRLGWAGEPVEGIEERVAADGELLVRGDMVFSGYLHDPAATEAAITDGWLHTGDIAEQDPATGNIRIVDRKKSIIITSGGKNITPSLIENALKECPYIEEAILLGDGRHFLSALIQIDLSSVGKWAQDRSLAYTNYHHLSGMPEVVELVQKHVDQVNARFARVENVRKFVILRKQLDHDDGEVTATMKVRRAAIEKKFADEIQMIYGRAQTQQEGAA